MMDDGVSTGGESWCAFLDGVRYCCASFMHLFLFCFSLLRRYPTTDLLLFVSPPHHFLFGLYCWFYLLLSCVSGEMARYEYGGKTRGEKGVFVYQLVPYIRFF